MTAKITFKRTGAQQVRINATIDMQVSGLREVMSYLPANGNVNRSSIDQAAQGGDSYSMLTVEQAADLLQIGRTRYIT